MFVSPSFLPFLLPLSVCLSSTSQITDYSWLEIALETTLVTQHRHHDCERNLEEEFLMTKRNQIYAGTGGRLCEKILLLPVSVSLQGRTAEVWRK